jgi:pimeloyl-ACP methyl ester carboxylesterase
MGPSDPPRRRVRLANGPAVYTDEGQGPVILAVHGLPGSVRDFRWLAPQLSGFARVVRIDLPGFGETPLETEPDASPAGRARLVLELARALELERPVLLGHSMGGVVACAAVDLAPDFFSGLALISSPGLRPHEMLRRVPFRVVSGVLSVPLLSTALRPAVRKFFAAGGFRGYSDEALARTFHCVAKTSIEQHAENVRNLSLPTLVSWCDDDPIIQSDIAEELAAACPSGPRLRYREGGHNPQKTHAREIARAMESWMASLGLSAPAS